MLKSIRKHFLLFSCLFCLLSLATPAILFSQNTSAVKDVCETTTDPELREAFGCKIEESLPTTIANIVKNIIAVCSLAAVIFIIIGGVDIMISTGDAAKIKKGKDTVLYATIGLIICAFSFLAVNWVLTSILKQTNDTPSNTTENAKPTIIRQTD